MFVFGLTQCTHSRHCGENSVTTWSPTAQRVDPLADRLDDARALVAEHRRGIARRVDARRRVHVGVADATRHEAHEHLARLGLLQVELLHDERLAELLENRSAHPHARATYPLTMGAGVDNRAAARRAGRRAARAAVRAALLGRQHAAVDEPDGDGGPVFSARSPRAVAHALLAPGQLGLSRAYVSGELDVDDLDARARRCCATWTPPPIDAAPSGAGCCSAPCARPALMRPPRPPAVELRPRGKRHSVERDARAVRHHYDVANEFFALFLDASMTYSCAIFEDPSRDDEPLESAQERKLETICRKLALTPGERVLDVGCGWGSFAIHAATRHGADVVGITLSEPQARAGARARGGGGRRRPRRDPRRRLPRDGRRAVRRDRQHRDGRARRRRAPRRVRGGAGAARSCPAGGC